MQPHYTRIDAGSISGSCSAQGSGMRISCNWPPGIGAKSLALGQLHRIGRRQHAHALRGNAVLIAAGEVDEFAQIVGVRHRRRTTRSAECRTRRTRQDRLLAPQQGLKDLQNPISSTRVARSKPAKRTLRRATGRFRRVQCRAVARPAQWRPLPGAGPWAQMLPMPCRNYGVLPGACRLGGIGRQGRGSRDSFCHKPFGSRPPYGLQHRRVTTCYGMAHRCLPEPIHGKPVCTACE
jgi:hypothetical protein